MSFASKANAAPRGPMLGRRTGSAQNRAQNRPQALFGRGESHQQKPRQSLGTPQGSLRLYLDSASVMQWERWSKSQLFYGVLSGVMCAAST